MKSLVEDKTILDISRDKDDNKFINAALVSNAKYLISGDRDLLILNEEFSINIIKPADFIKELS